MPWDGKLTCVIQLCYENVVNEHFKSIKGMAQKSPVRSNPNGVLPIRSFYRKLIPVNHKMIVI